MLTLRIDIVDCSVTKTINFSPTTLVYDACQVIRDKVPEALAPNESDVKNYGLFYTEENKKSGIWLEAAKSLEYYVLRNGDILEYKKKIRTLKVRMLDDSVKTLYVDDSHTVSQIMITICTKIGITNHEEYSLVRDVTEVEREKTMTMKRDKSIARNQKKMDEMKKKLHTDDELDWLDHSRSLREQGVDEKATLLLRRKYFFSDQNVDARDPIQLHLLYVQTRDNIMKGALPVSQERALEFAGLQCQVQYGDYNEQKHKPGFLEMKEVLPKEYRRTKGIEKKIYLEQAKNRGLSELDAKARYTQLARSLPTYGIAFFLVKEKVKGKNKLSTTLLGISKESVVKIDNDKKEIVKTWPLTTVKRWAPSPNTFTLDFGDYADSYYCVQTLEGEQIAQLISGYIDIILKKKQAKDHLGLEGDEESTMYEDSVCPAKATIIQHQSVGKGQAMTGNVALPALLRSGDTDATAASHHMQQPMHSNLSQLSHLGHRLPSGQTAGSVGLGGGQRALLGRIGEGLEALGNTQKQLNYKADLPPLGNDPGSRNWRQMTSDNSRQRLNAQLSSLNTATAQVVLLTANQPDADLTALESAVQTISSNMGNFSRDVRMLAALDDSDDLMGAARSLVGAFSDLLESAQSGSTETDRYALLPRQKLLNAANRVGEAGDGVLHLLQEESTPKQQAFKDNLMTSARQVASRASELVRQAKKVSEVCGSKEEQNAVVEAATTCALSSSQLVACSRVLAGTIEEPQCQEQLSDAAQCVATSVHDVVAVSEDVCEDEEVLGGLKESAQKVTAALEQLMGLVTSANGHKEAAAQMEAIMLTTERLCDNSHNTQEVVRQTRTLAQATSSLVTSLKTEAEDHEDSEQQNKLLSAAKLLADATARMVEAAKGCASEPGSEACRGALREAADELRNAASIAADGAFKTPELHNLQNATKRATTATTQLIYAVETASQWNSSQQTQQQLNSLCASMSNDTIPRLNQALRQSHRETNNPESLSRLNSAAHDFIQPCNRLVTGTRAALPTIGDQASCLLVNNCLNSLSSCLVHLKACLQSTKHVCSPISSFEAAMQQIEGIEKELEETQKTGKLVPLPGDSLTGSSHQLGATSKAVATAVAHLLTAATQGREDEAGACSRDVAQRLDTFSASVRGVAATTDDSKLVEHAIDVVHKGGVLVQQARNLVTNPSDLDAKNKLAMATKVVSQSLTSCVACMPGVKEVDEVAKKVSEASKKINTCNQNGAGIYKGTECSLQQVQLQLNSTAEDLNQVTQDLMQACQSADKDVTAVSSATDKLANTHEQLLDDALDVVRQTKDGNTRTNMLQGLTSVSSCTSRFLAASKALLGDPEAVVCQSSLKQAARHVSDSINQLISLCTTASPCQRQCDDAIRHIQSLKQQGNCTPTVDSSYPQCLNTIVHNTKNLASAMGAISSSASEPEQFCRSVQSFKDSVVSIVEHAQQATFLAGAGAEGSEEGSAGIVDQASVATASHNIEVACAVLANSCTNHQQMLAAVSTIAHHTSLLCNACRHASNKAPEAATKAAFVQCAKDLANNTASMVKAMKACTEEFPEKMHEVGATTGQSLLHCLSDMTTFLQSPNFAATPAFIGRQGLRLQKPLKQATDEVIDHSTSMLTASKAFSTHPNDPAIHSSYSNHSHSLSEALKRLLSNIKNHQPGELECNESLDQIHQLIRDVDNLSLESRDVKSYGVGMSMQACHDQAVNSVRQVRSLVEPLQRAAKGGGNLGRLVKSATSYMTPFKSSLLGCVAKTTDSRQQGDLLAQCKTVAESLHSLILLAKEASVESQSTELHGRVDEAADECCENIDSMVHTLTTTASNSGVVSLLLQHINRSIALTSEESVQQEAGELSELQTNIVNTLKLLTKNAQEMNVKATTENVQALGSLADNITHQYASLVHNAMQASVACSCPQTSSRMKTCMQQLGGHCHSLVQAAGKVMARPSDTFAKKELDQQVKKILESSAATLGVLHSSARGTQACITACNSIRGIVADLDTCVMFASAGTLTAEPDLSFANYREGILTTAKDLVEDTKQLVAGAAMKQQQLADAATKAAGTIDLLSSRIKKAAASLGAEQNEAQVLLMNAAKDVAVALNDLISVTKVAAGKPQQHPAMTSLKEAAKVMVTNVTSLLKTVKTVEDETLMTSQAIDTSIEAVCQEIKAYRSTERAEEAVSPDQVIQATRPVAIATSKAVAAANSGRQDDMVAAANQGRRAVSDVLRSCKGAVVAVEDKELQERLLHSGLSCAEAFKELLLLVQLRGRSAEADLKQQVAAASKRVAVSVTDVVHAAEAIKGVDWADPQDATAIAEAELLSAANSIEAAARKLTTLKPKLKPKQADETLTFEEQLLQAAKSITTATSALVRAASSAQKELLMQGKVGQLPEDVDSDSQWSQGLISAAKLVALATHSLCDAANAMVQGHASEERLISAAKQVAASTAQLLLACKVKASPNSQAMRRLQTAGHAVKRATEALVKEAQGMRGQEEEQGVEVSVNNKMVTDMAQIIMAQEEILRKEKELENARKKLETIRKAKYRHEDDDDDDD